MNDQFMNGLKTWDSNQIKTLSILLHLMIELQCKSGQQNYNNPIEMLVKTIIKNMQYLIEKLIILFTTIETIQLMMYLPNCDVHRNSTQIETIQLVMRIYLIDWFWFNSVDIGSIIVKTGRDNQGIFAKCSPVQGTENWNDVIWKRRVLVDVMFQCCLVVCIIVHCSANFNPLTVLFNRSVFTRNKTSNLTYY